MHNDVLPPADQELLKRVEALLDGQEHEDSDPGSLDRLCVHLSGAMPRADPVFQERLEIQLISRLEQRKKENRSMNHIEHRRGSSAARLRTYVPLGFVVLALVCVVSTMLWVPPVQAQVLGVLRQLGLVLVNTTELEEPTPSSTANVREGFQEIPLLSLSEAQQKVRFPIPTPTWLPAGLTLRGVFVRGDWVALSYVRNAPGSELAGLGIEIARGGTLGGYTFPQSAVQPAVVHSHQALYIYGAWTNGFLGRNRWDDSADVSTLVWEANGVSYKIQGSGLRLSRDHVIRVAESLP